jgi:hypothetical protein
MRVDGLRSGQVRKMAETAEAIRSLRAALTETVPACQAIAEGTTEDGLELDAA